MPGGRPTDYTQEIADIVCKELSQGKSLRKVCLDDNLPSAATIFNWLAKNKEFLEQYTRAKESSSEALNEMLMDIGDQAIEHAESTDTKVSGAIVQAYKLKADNMKWYMSKVKPKKYGDKVDVTSGGEAIKGNTIVIGDFKDATGT